MLFTALQPAPPTPMTVIRGLSSCVGGTLTLIDIIFLHFIVDYDVLKFIIIFKKDTYNH